MIPGSCGGDAVSSGVKFLTQHSHFTVTTVITVYAKALVKLPLHL